MASSTDYAWIDEIVPGALMVQPAVCTHVLIITEPPVRRGATVFMSTIEVNSKLGIHKAVQHVEYTERNGHVKLVIRQETLPDGEQVDCTFPDPVALILPPAGWPDATQAIARTIEKIKSKQWSHFTALCAGLCFVFGLGKTSSSRALWHSHRAALNWPICSSLALAIHQAALEDHVRGRAMQLPLQADRVLPPVLYQELSGTGLGYLATATLSTACLLDALGALACPDELPGGGVRLVRITELWMGGRLRSVRRSM